MHTKFRNVAINALVVAISLCIGLVLCEGFLRVRAHYNNTLNARFTVWTRDIPYINNDPIHPGNLYGVLAPNSSYALSIYDEEGKMGQRNFVAVNNYGWLSKHDYHVKKDPDEFRIAVIGDSFTGTATNPTYWSDTLQDLLNQDPAIHKSIGGKRVAVYNFGQAGTGMEHFFFPLSHIAYRFSPDIVVVNFITEDILRRHMPSDEVSYDPRKEASIDENAPPVEKPASYTLKYQDMEIPVSCSSRWDCSAYQIYVPDGRKLSVDEVNGLRLYAAKSFSRQKTLFARKSFLLDLFKQAAPNALTSKDIQLSLDAMVRIRELFPNVIMVHVPTHHSLLFKDHMKTLLEDYKTAAQKVGFDTIHMHNWMPIHRDPAEIKRWFNLPHDGHWTDTGANLYAKAMHHMLREKLLGGEKLVCDTAFDHFDKGNQSVEANHNNEALKEFSAAVFALPHNAAALYHNAGTYVECGFLLDLYRKYAEVLLATNDKASARIYAQKASALQPDSSETDMLLIKIGLTKKDMARAIHKLRKRADATPDIEPRVTMLLQASGLAVSNDLNADAEAMYREVLRLMPNHLPALEGLAGVLMDRGEYQEALGLLNAAIVQAPTKPEIIAARTQAKKVLQDTTP